MLIYLGPCAARAQYSAGYTRIEDGESAACHLAAGLQSVCGTTRAECTHLHSEPCACRHSKKLMGAHTVDARLDRASAVLPSMSLS